MDQYPDHVLCRLIFLHLENWFSVGRDEGSQGSGEEKGLLCYLQCCALPHTLWKQMTSPAHGSYTFTVPNCIFPWVDFTTGFFFSLNALFTHTEMCNNCISSCTDILTLGLRNFFAVELRVCFVTTQWINRPLLPFFAFLIPPSPPASMVASYIWIKSVRGELRGHPDHLHFALLRNVSVSESKKEAEAYTNTPRDS